MISVRASFQALKPEKTEDRRPLVSNCWRTCATFASAVGETKLALTAMSKKLGSRRAVLCTGGGARVAEGRT